jgi:hypothetical protein
MSRRIRIGKVVWKVPAGAGVPSQAELRRALIGELASLSDAATADGDRERTASANVSPSTPLSTPVAQAVKRALTGGSDA